MDAPIAAMTIDSQPFSAASGESSPNALMRAWTRRGFDARRSSAASPRRRDTPVPQPSTNTSLRSISAARPLPVVVVGEVDLEAPLAPRPALPRRVGAESGAAGRFEQPHLGAGVGEHLADDRGGQRVRGGDDAEAGQGTRLVVGHLAHPSIVPVGCQFTRWSIPFRRPGLRQLRSTRSAHPCRTATRSTSRPIRT